MSSATLHTASMSVQVVFCGEVLKAKRTGPRYVRPATAVQSAVPGLREQVGGRVVATDEPERRVPDQQRYGLSRSAVVGQRTELVAPESVISGTSAEPN